ncbi:GNAT family N-acetyltransferase [Planomicrobium sp. YIM 101495]|uniref:GNAT family N-acetyltransferase n=1 Tax=Planomicrobium sp. YIM 101495 TaxID=2665160 RepID=UPI0018A9300C|nr:GNAT family N-acetyltransferase [Planomicrobium sp. YIM 101495]
MVELRVLQNEDLQEVSRFISQLNNHEETHIGYCGEDEKEIAKSMEADITDVKYAESFVGAYERNQLIGVLGFDADLEDGSAEIWGPFLLDWKRDLAFAMWEKTMDLLPGEIKSLEMFPNRRNVQVCQLAKDLSFEKYSDETILLFTRDNSMELESAILEELTPTFELAMKRVHDQAFHGAYYNAQQILARLNEHRKVFIMTRGDVFCGYIYVEAEPEFGEASIEFFAVEESERGNGVGATLLTGALQWLFTFENMDSITLCVNSKNRSAINLYKKVGFQHLYDLCAYTKDIRQGSMDEKEREAVLKKEVLELEQRLMHYRKADFEALLSETFVEFGSSGAVYDKEMAIELLGMQALEEIPFILADFELVELAPGLVQARYRTTHNVTGSQSLRSSLWKMEDSVWRMAFHQGTITG